MTEYLENGVRFGEFKIVRVFTGKGGRIKCGL